MIGHKIYQIISKKYIDTFALIRSNSNLLPYINIYDQRYLLHECDLSDFAKLEKILCEIRPDIIINAAGITIRRGVEDNIRQTLILNSLLPKYLSNWCNSNNSWFIHLSTDCVFNGEKGNYTELDFPDARDLYGLTKSLGEIYKDTLVIRGSFIGRELANHTELLEWFLRTGNESIVGYHKVLYSGISTITLAEYILLIIEKHFNLKGLFNVSSFPITKYDLLKLFNTHFNKNIEIIKSLSYESNKILNSSKFFNLTGLTQPSWHEMIIKLKEDSILNQAFYNK